MKYVVISKLAPGVENARKALEVFKKAGLPQETEATWAATDGKTFINVVESDTPDMKVANTYAPFFSEIRHPCRGARRELAPSNRGRTSNLGGSQWA